MALYIDLKLVMRWKSFSTLPYPPFLMCLQLRVSLAVMVVEMKVFFCADRGSYLRLELQSNHLRFGPFIGFVMSSVYYRFFYCFYSSARDLSIYSMCVGVRNIFLTKNLSFFSFQQLVRSGTEHPSQRR